MGAAHKLDIQDDFHTLYQEAQKHGYGRFDHDPQAKVFVLMPVYQRMVNNINRRLKEVYGNDYPDIEEDAVHIKHKDGEGMIMSLAEYGSLEESEYLYMQPGFLESMKETDSEETISAEDLPEDLQWANV